MVRKINIKEFLGEAYEQVMKFKQFWNGTITQLIDENGNIIYQKGAYSGLHRKNSKKL
jgi:hypothetical protein